jgi:hypothetical protein
VRNACKSPSQSLLMLRLCCLISCHFSHRSCCTILSCRNSELFLQEIGVIGMYWC